MQKSIESIYEAGPHDSHEGQGNSQAPGGVERLHWLQLIDSSNRTAVKLQRSLVAAPYVISIIIRS